MKILFFDTETNGLPKRWDAPAREVDNWPRIIQLAWLVMDETGKVFRKQSHLIKPDGWEVPVEKFWVDHGYTQGKSEQLGIPMRNALDIFLADHDQCDYMVAHNMNFDRPIIGAEIIRYNRNALAKPKQICTMLEGTLVCKIPGPRGYKWPKLEELHKVLFGAGFEGAHDALNDIVATSKCFFELVNRKIIDLK